MKGEKFLPPTLTVIAEAHALDSREKELDGRAGWDPRDFASLVQALKPPHVDIGHELDIPPPHLAHTLPRLTAEALQVDSREREKFEVRAHHAAHAFDFAARLVEGGLQPLEEVAGFLLDDLGDEIVLRLELIVEGSGGHVRLPHDVGDACLLEVGLLKNAQGGIDEALSLHLFRDGRPSPAALGRRVHAPLSVLRIPGPARAPRVRGGRRRGSRRAAATPAVMRSQVCATSAALVGFHARKKTNPATGNQSAATARRPGPSERHAWSRRGAKRTRTSQVVSVRIQCGRSSLHKDGHEDRVERSQLDLPERGAGAMAPERNERGSQAVESAREERSRRPRPGECTQHEESRTRAFDGLARHVGAHPRPKIVARRPVPQRKDVPRV